jgi:hypothetical protein
LTGGDSSPFPIIEIDDVSTFYANLTVEQFKVAKKVRVVNPAPFLSTSGKGRSMLSFPKKAQPSLKEMLRTDCLLSNREGCG